MAERQYRDLIGHTHVINYEYDDQLRELAKIYNHMHRPREAAFVYLYPRARARRTSGCAPGSPR